MQGNLSYISCLAFSSKLKPFDSAQGSVLAVIGLARDLCRSPIREGGTIPERKSPPRFTRPI
jgi:hypothetical protein